MILLLPTNAPLGVRVQDLGICVIVTGTAPGSAAAREGVVAGDVLDRFGMSSSSSSGSGGDSYLVMATINWSSSRVTFAALQTFLGKGLGATSSLATILNSSSSYSSTSSSSAASSMGNLISLRSDGTAAGGGDLTGFGEFDNSGGFVSVTGSGTGATVNRAFEFFHVSDQSHPFFGREHELAALLSGKTVQSQAPDGTILPPMSLMLHSKMAHPPKNPRIGSEFQAPEPESVKTEPATCEERSDPGSTLVDPSVSKWKLIWTPERRECFESVIISQTSRNFVLVRNEMHRRGHPEVTNAAIVWYYYTYWKYSREYFRWKRKLKVFRHARVAARPANVMKGSSLSGSLYTKANTEAGQDLEAVAEIAAGVLEENDESDSRERPASTGRNTPVPISNDRPLSSLFCYECNCSGDLLHCSTCYFAFHLECLIPRGDDLVEGVITSGGKRSFVLGNYVEMDKAEIEQDEDDFTYIFTLPQDFSNWCCPWCRSELLSTYERQRARNLLREQGVVDVKRLAKRRQEVVAAASSILPYLGLIPPPNINTSARGAHLNQTTANSGSARGGRGGYRGPKRRIPASSATWWKEVPLE